MKPVLSINGTTESDSETKPSTAAVLLIATLCIIFGGNTVAVKTSLSGFGPFTNAGIRFLIASFLVGLWAVCTGRPLKIKRHLWPRVLLLTMLFFTQIVLIYLGMTKTLASRGALISNLQPFFVLIFAHFFIAGDSISWKKFIGIAFGFIGAAFIFFDKKSINSNMLTGDFLIFAATLVWAINAIVTKRIVKDFRPYLLAIVPGFLSFPLFLICGYFFDEKMIFNINAQTLTALFYQSVIAAAIGYVLWTTMVRKYGAVTLHSYIFLMPVSGVFFGGLLLGEPVATLNILFALIFIICGVIIVHSSRQ